MLFLPLKLSSVSAASFQDTLVYSLFLVQDPLCFA